VQNNYGKTALIIAALMGRKDVVDALLALIIVIWIRRMVMVLLH
jgi:ankyrin repeat protein